MTLLNETGTYTLFAPNNAALVGFNATDNVPEVKATLKYHLLTSEVTSGVLQSIQFPHTASNNPDYVTLNGEGQVLEVTKKDSKVEVNSVQVVTVDLECSNGVIHVIDKILALPLSTAEVAKTNHQMIWLQLSPRPTLLKLSTPQPLLPFWLLRTMPSISCLLLGST